MKHRLLVSSVSATLLLSCSTLKEPDDSLAREIKAQLDGTAPTQRFRGLGVRLLPDPLGPQKPDTPAVQSLSVRDMPARDILRALFVDSDVSVLLDQSVGGQGTFDIKNASAEDVFENVVESFDLAYRFDGDILHIGSEEERVFHVDIPALDPTPVMGLGQQVDGGGQANNQQQQQQQMVAPESEFWVDLRRDLEALRVDDNERLVVNSRLGTVLAAGRPSFVNLVERYVDAAQSRASRQVSLEVRVLEVQLSDEFKTGVDWSLLPGFFNISNPANHGGTLAGGAIVGQAAQTGVSTFNFGFLNAGQFDIFVDAMEKQGQVRVISKPRVSTLNNVPAIIRVVEQVPVFEREIIDSDGVSRTQFNVRFEDAGVAVSVTPQIGEDDLITCVVQPTITEVSGFVATPDNLINEPILNTRTVTTTIGIPDGQPVVIGGLRAKTTSENLESVPILGSIPLLGALFRRTEQVYTETELVLVLYPRILTPAWLREDVERGIDRVLQLRRGYTLSTIRMRDRESEWREPLLGGEPSEPDLSQRRSQASTSAQPSISRATLGRVELRRAVDALQDGNTRRAWDHLQRALGLDPEIADAWLLRAVLEERRSNARAAKASYLRSLQLLPDSPLPRNNLGLHELRTGNPIAAEGHFLAALEQRELGPIQNNLGLAYLAQGRLDEAAQAFARACEIDPTLPEAHVNLGYCRDLRGNEPAATTAYRQFLLAGGDPADPRLQPLRSRWMSLGVMGK